MADWTNVADATLEPGKPTRAIDARALRENPIAIAEGAPGAPKIEDAALDTTVTSAGTDWVLARTAGATVGAVGSYALLRRNSSADPDDTIAGSELFYAGALNAASAAGNFVDDPGFFVAINVFAFAAGALTSPAGTWRCMGRINITATSNPADGTRSASGATLWLRIS